MTDPNVFEQFTPSVNYPKPDVNAIFITDSVPTNSWAQGSISTLLDSDRAIKFLPWYVLPNYVQNPGIGLCHIDNHNTSVIFSDGNISAINVPSPKIRILGETKMTKYGSMYTQYEIENSIEAFFNRGSPYATFKYNNTTVKINITEGAATSLVSSFGNTKHIISISDVLTYSSNEKLLPDNNILVSDKLAIYEYLTPIAPVTANYNGKETKFKFTINNTKVEVIVQSEKHIITDVEGTLVIKEGHWDDKSGVFGITFTIDNDTSTYTYTYDPKFDIATITRSIPYVYQIVLYTSALLLTLLNNVITSPVYNGSIMTALLSNTDLENMLDENHGIYLESSDIIGYGTDYYNWRISYFHPNIGTQLSTIILLPSHWDNYTLSSILTKVNSPHILIDITYGELNYYIIKSTISSDIIKVSFPNFTFREDIDISTLTPGEIDALKKQVLIDASFTKINTSANPYTYGQEAAAAGRICLFAFKLNITSIDLTTLKKLLFDSLVSWFTNTNPSIFHLSYDSIWKGIVVPADDINKNSGKTAFGNSYYNDHHFHYGYILYAVWCLMKIGSNIGVIYSKQINNLIYDVCNPLGNSFSTKMRHKDFYAGHSWATGVPFPRTNPLDRQQESSSEAINCYYSVYLVAKELGLIMVQNAARVALKIEIDSSDSYYKFQGSRTKEGIFSGLPGVGILQLLGKGYTLDWVMQPNTFPGRSIGIYGIQSIPTTDISFISVSARFSTDIQTSTPSYYSTTISLIQGLTDNIYNSVYPPNTSFIFDTKTQGGFWGNVGMIMLTPSFIDRSEIWQAWLNILNKQKTLDGVNNNEKITSNSAIKNFDSYSNTLYWLMIHSVFKSEGNTEFISNGHNNKFTQRLKVCSIYAKGKYINKKLTIVFCDDRQIKLIVDLFDLVIGENDHTLAEKALNLDIHPNNIIKYIITKIILIYLSCDIDIDNNINGLLTRSANDMIIKSIKTGPVCYCLKLLLPYPNFENFFK